MLYPYTYSQLPPSSKHLLLLLILHQQFLFSDGKGKAGPGRYLHPKVIETGTNWAGRGPQVWRGPFHGPSSLSLSSR